MTEKQLQTAVLELAQRIGYLRAHFRPSLTQAGSWVTAMTGDVGFPDCVLVGRVGSPVEGRVMFIELKQDRKKLGAAQVTWFDAFQAAGAESYLFRPADWLSGRVESALRGDRTEAA